MELDCEDCCPEPFDEALLDCDDEDEDDDDEDGDDCDCDEELDEDDDCEVELDEDGEPDVEGMPDEDVVCCIEQAPSAAVRAARSRRLSTRRTPL